MQFLGIAVILLGIFLTNSAVKNRNPVDIARALLKDPTDINGTLSKFTGTWDNAPVVTSIANAASNAAGNLAVKVAGMFGNGKLPDSALQAIPWNMSQRLVPSAANALGAMNDAYKAAFGTNISITDSYRSYAQQVSVKASKGYLAATPGTSNHGLGIALDLGGGINSFGTAQHKWMDVNGPKYGWSQPTWARATGSKPEAWHYEYGGN